MDRWYIRCADCLSIGSIDYPYDPQWSCGICGGHVELMGKVVRDHLEREESKAACDERCTRAQGPICVCKCLCANHGTGRRVSFVVRENIPVIEFEPDEKALEFATYWNQSKSGMDTYIQTLPYFQQYKARRAMRKAIDSRTRKARIKYVNLVFGNDTKVEVVS